MGWIAVYKDGHMEREDDGLVGRPMAAGENGDLMCIAQEDYNHRVAIDLVNGVIAFDYENPIRVQNKTVELDNPKLFFWVCEETTRVGELKNRETKLHPKKIKGKIVRDENKKAVMVKTDYETSLIWRPIWFTRNIMGTAPIKVIGLQTTTPEGYGGRNVKKLISLYSDGRMGID